MVALSHLPPFWELSKNIFMGNWWTKDCDAKKINIFVHCISADSSDVNSLIQLFCQINKCLIESAYFFETDLFDDSLLAMFMLNILLS